MSNEALRQDHGRVCKLASVSLTLLLQHGMEAQLADARPRGRQAVSGRAAGTLWARLAAQLASLHKPVAEAVKEALRRLKKADPGAAPKVGAGVCGGHDLAPAVSRQGLQHARGPDDGLAAAIAYAAILSPTCSQWNSAHSSGCHLSLPGYHCMHRGGLQQRQAPTEGAMPHVCK